MAFTSNSLESVVIEINNTQCSPVNLSSCLEFWMSQLPTKLKELPITQLAIPGSHNTMTYTIERNNEIGPDLHNLVKLIGRYLSIFVKPIVFSWSINQEEHVKVQLDAGIRYLDLRVSTKTNDSKIYFLHGLYGAEISRPLEDIADWLTKHPNEVVILDFQHFYNFNTINHRGLIDKLNYLFAGKICPVHPSFDNISLKWLNELNYQVFIIYRSIVATNYSNLWPSNRWPTPWPDTVDPTKLVDYLNDGLQTRSLLSGFVSQGLLTPDFSFIAKHPCGNLCRNLIPICRKVVIPWIEQHSPGKEGMNVVISDDIGFDNFLFSRTVIERNNTLL